MLVVKIPRIVEEFRPGGTALDAGAALDADAPDRRHIRRVDGAHGA